MESSSFSQPPLPPLDYNNGWDVFSFVHEAWRTCYKYPSGEFVFNCRMNCYYMVTPAPILVTAQLEGILPTPLPGGALPAPYARGSGEKQTKTYSPACLPSFIPFP